ncbi:hypothetical protein Y032_0016g2983 [Ancylostoma ceylanicum]|uniref:Uncharacterized protein n=1 Tax=Ancylostoma ceylanicum TaxID=53326 RepID=A0A016V7Y0_9BILA|nr:hypothetical protein Y032_0016g2983 [Ancylostoma ceylanicum]
MYLQLRASRTFPDKRTSQPQLSGGFPGKLRVFVLLRTINLNLMPLHGQALACFPTAPKRFFVMIHFLRPQTRR